MIVYVSIGNSDDKLTQERWSEFWRRVDERCRIWADDVYGVWVSSPIAPWQDACWCIEIRVAGSASDLKVALRDLAEAYDQDSIAWAEATTEFLTPR